MRDLRKPRMILVIPVFLILICLVSVGDCNGRNVWNRTLDSHVWLQGNNSIAAGTQLANKRVEMAYKWLRCQQEEKTGLFRSNGVPGGTRIREHDTHTHISNIGWTYDQALAITAFLAVGDVDAARRCADAMLKIRHEIYHAWADGYNVCTGEVEAQPVAVGPNAWMGLALLHLYENTGEHEYLSAAERIGEFICTLQSNSGRTKGSVSGGYDIPKNKNEEKKLFPWTSTEHNADSVAFLVALGKLTHQSYYCEAATRIADWLEREMWDPNVECYRSGYKCNATAKANNPKDPNDSPELLDSQTWTILAIRGASKRIGRANRFRESLHNGLSYIDCFRCMVKHNDKTCVGFPKRTCDVQVHSSVWTEGTAGYILAARCGEKEDPNNVQAMLESLRNLQYYNGSVPYSVGVSFPDVNAQFKPSDLVVADFEAHPNRLSGIVDAYGDAKPDWDVIAKPEPDKCCNTEPSWDAIGQAEADEPYSWYYISKKPGEKDPNVYTGRQSFRLVNAGKACRYKKQGWANIGLDLGPIVECITPDSVDVSAYKQLSFWAKKAGTEHAKLRVIFRDRHRRSYNVQAVPEPCELTQEWQNYTVDLDNIRSIIDIKHITQIALSFGKDVGSERGAVIYVDDVAFTGSPAQTTASNGRNMPPVYPQHWPAGSIAGTAWLIFVELRINPFGPFQASQSSAPYECVSTLKKNYCGQYSLPCSLFRDWLGLSANLDTSYRRTQFYKRGDNARVFQGDSRVDFWLPPFRSEFSWGPYVRFSGVASNTNYEWENNWGARPGVGFQIYPFGSRKLKEECELYSSFAELLGPVHVFAEHDEVQYSGREHSWRPDELVRIGVDFWSEWHVDDIREPTWAETWHGLVWHSTNGFDKDYDTLIFANALRLGIRKPNAGVVSMFTPYMAFESSLSENGKYFWENRLLLGGGVRFAPPLKFLPPEWNMTRFVVYAEYLNAVAYYRSSATSSVPDEDFRVGINVYIGEWWHR